MASSHHVSAPKSFWITLACRVGLILLFGFGSASRAATWINPASGDWNVATNWDTTLVPGSSDPVVIDQGTAFLTSNVPDILSLELGASPGTSQLVVGADLTILNNIVGIGSATQATTNGVVQTDGTLSVAGGSTTSYILTNGTYDISGGGLAIKNNKRLDVKGTLRLSGDGRVDIAGGTTSQPRFGVLTGETGNGVQTGGTLTAGGSVFIGVRGMGFYDMSGGTIWASNNFTLGSSTIGPGEGTLTQTGGTIVVGSGIAGSGQTFVGQNGPGLYSMSGGTLFARELTLGGGGTANGTVIQTGGTIDLLTGPAGPGSLTVGEAGAGYYLISGGTVLASNLTISPTGTLSVLSNAVVHCTGILDLAGTLDFTFHPTGVSEITLTGGGVSAIDPSATINVDGASYSGGPGVFTLIDAASFEAEPIVYLSGFELGASYDWDLTNGDLTVAVGQLPVPPERILEYTLSNGVLRLDWPLTHIGWRLQVQTNDLHVGLSTNWVTMPGSTDTNSLSSSIDMANASVFYRLASPIRAFAPSPPDGWPDADPLTMIRWSTYQDALCQVYFGTNSALDVSDLQTTVTTNLHYPGPLETNMTYYWRIDVMDGTNTVVGPLWSFTTGSSPGAFSNIDVLPNEPADYLLRDWQAVAQDYIAVVSDFGATGQYLPVVWWDESNPNFKISTPYIPSFVGISQGGDALNLFGTIIGGTLVGIDMSQHNGSDWVSSMLQFQGTSVGRQVIGNNKTGERSTGLWYDVVPGIYFCEAVELYPSVAQVHTPYSFQPGGATMEQVMYETASKWYEVLEFLGGGETGVADFTGVVGFNTVTMEIDDRDGTHPGVLECAAGLAWIEYMAYRKFGDPKFLTGTQWALNYLDTVSRNPMHNGVQMGYGILTAARMNAELGYSHDVDQSFRWTFGEGDPLRDGWGVLYGSWGGYEVSGLIGTEAARGGANRAYAKQGFHLVASLAPLVRYDQRYARAVGKWILHKSSSSRHYYQTFLPDGHRDSPFWAGDPEGVIPFESLRGYHPQSYFEGYLADLDASPGSNPDVRALVSEAVTNLPAIWGSGWAGSVNGGLGLCLYFGGDVGLLGGIVKPTNIEKILRVDLLLTDFYRDPAYPSYLYYNPVSVEKTIQLDVGTAAVDVYDTVTHTFLLSNVSGLQNLSIPPDSARVVVLTPPGGELSVSGRVMSIGGVVVDFYR